jgi:uncharacterized repeat protein (TIGR01451 family)
MKRLLPIGFGILAAAATLPFMTNTPVLASLQEAGTSIVKNILQPKVQLKLEAQKKIVTTSPEGKEIVTWTALKERVTVQPGDVIRYQLNSENASDQPAKNLVVTQPIPPKTNYVLTSAKTHDAVLTFSIDGGKTFVEKPMVKVKVAEGKEELRPAPAEAYTHVRWDYGNSLTAMAEVQASDEVSVK